jgi:hypothetical protein
MYRSALRPAALTLFTLALACKDSTEPTMAGVAGTYNATTFITTTSGTATNQLARGATLSIVLTAQGTVTGALVIPADAANPAVNESMSGTWSLNGSTVSFSQTADTFVRDMAFTFTNGTLVGDQTFSGTRIQATLTRQ